MKLKTIPIFKWWPINEFREAGNAKLENIHVNEQKFWNTENNGNGNDNNVEITGNKQLCLCYQLTKRSLN